MKVKLTQYLGLAFIAGHRNRRDDAEVYFIVLVLQFDLGCDLAI